MVVGTIKETYPGERRVGLVPGVVPMLTKAGLEVLIEAGAGEAAGFEDQDFVDKGAHCVPRGEVISKSDMLAVVRGYGANPEHGRELLDAMRPGQVLLALYEPLTAHEEVKAAAARGITLFAMELIPRITRAQSMDVLSSMGTIAGYKAVLIAANQLAKMFPMMMTAAGTITPARLFVIGVGVAGLQAIASGRRLGAQVEAYDVRPVVKEQVESLGAKFIEMELDAGSSETAGGYAKALGEEFYRKQRELMTRVIAEQDVVITTAAVPGKKAPLLVTEQMVSGMRRGSVVVDLAAERGGNCELTRPGETVVAHGVTIIGPHNVPSEIPFHASQMYARNLTNLALLLTKDGQLNIDTEDEIVQGTLVTHQGEFINAQVRELLGIAGATT